MMSGYSLDGNGDLVSVTILHKGRYTDSPEMIGGIMITVNGRPLSEHLEVVEQVEIRREFYHQAFKCRHLYRTTIGGVCTTPSRRTLAMGRTRKAKVISDPEGIFLALLDSIPKVWREMFLYAPEKVQARIYWKWESTRTPHLITIIKKELS